MDAAQMGKGDPDWCVHSMCDPVLGGPALFIRPAEFAIETAAGVIFPQVWILWSLQRPSVREAFGLRRDAPARPSR